jgi:AraC family transcriptional regulator
VQVYNGPDTEFVKWAALEVEDFSYIPEYMQAYTLAGGLYAVFIHIGPPAAFEKTFQYIFNEWLPHSIYTLDDREHFEILGAKYKNNEPDSEEEIWIPIKPKAPINA